MITIPLVVLCSSWKHSLCDLGGISRLSSSLADAEDWSALNRTIDDDLSENVDSHAIRRPASSLIGRREIAVPFDGRGPQNPKSLTLVPTVESECLVLTARPKLHILYNNVVS